MTIISFITNVAFPPATVAIPSAIKKWPNCTTVATTSATTTSKWL